MLCGSAMVFEGEPGRAVLSQAASPATKGHRVLSAAGGSRSALPKVTWEIQQYPKPPAHSWGVYISIIQMGLARKMAGGLGMVP